MERWKRANRRDALQARLGVGWQDLESRPFDKTQTWELAETGVS